MTRTASTPSNVEYITGSIFDSKQPALGHGVNVEGVMGSGIAVLVRRKYPSIFLPYEDACKRGLLVPGSMLPIQVEENKWVFNIASQAKRGRDARVEWLEDSIYASFHYASVEGITGIALPRIASDIGGLDWRTDTIPVLEKVASSYPQIQLELWSLPNAK